MSLRWSEEQLQSLLKGMHDRETAPRDRRNIPAARKTEIAIMGGRARQAKYRNTPVEVDGRKFPSKKQAEYYQQLLLRKAAGDIRGFACEVTVPLASGKRSMRIDFVEVHNDLSVHWIDTKGVVTKDWAVKRDELEHSLGIKIETI